MIPKTNRYGLLQINNFVQFVLSKVENDHIATICDNHGTGIANYKQKRKHNFELKILIFCSFIEYVRFKIRIRARTLASYCNRIPHQFDLISKLKYLVLYRTSPMNDELIFRLDFRH